MNLELNDIITILQQRLEKLKDFNLSYSVARVILDHDSVREAWRELELKIEQEFKTYNEMKAKSFGGGKIE